MLTLTSNPVAPLLERLFTDSDNSKASVHARLASLSRKEINAIMHSKTHYLDFYSQFGDVAMPVSRETGRLLYMLARATRARSIIEFGTSFGVSTIHLASALRDNGGGRLIASEFEPSKIARAGANLAAAGLADLVDLREGDALHTLACGLPDRVDLLLLDGAKALYLDILELVESRLVSGSIVLADNAGGFPPYLLRVRDSDSGYMSMPFGKDVELSIRL